MWVLHRRLEQRSRARRQGLLAGEPLVGCPPGPYSSEIAGRGRGAAQTSSPLEEVLVGRQEHEDLDSPAALSPAAALPTT
jgi:hypothetical protein